MCHFFLNVVLHEGEDVVDEMGAGRTHSSIDDNCENYWLSLLMLMAHG